MLAAITNNKSKKYDTFREDEITSCIFEPLSYMHVDDVWLVCSSFIQDTNTEKPDRFEIKFWPRLDLIEPDLQINFYWQGKLTVKLVIEVKWNSPISGHDQLVKQWQKIEDKEKAWHIYLVKNYIKGLNEVESSLEQSNDKLWSKRLHCVSWLKFLQYICEISTTSEAFLLWQKRVSDFLSRYGIKEFSGFQFCANTKINTSNSVVFWKSFQCLEIAKNTTIKQQTSIFWENTNECK